MTLTENRETKKSVGAGRGKIPSKRTINLAAVADTKMNVKLAIPGVILVLVAAALIGKFAVADRLVAMSRATAETARVQSQLDEAYAKIASYSSMEDDFAHYSYAGMTQEELDLTSRADVIEMMDRVIDDDSTSNTWSISGNRLTIEVTGDTLQQINELARQLEKEPLVDFCTVTNAAMKEIETTNSTTTNAGIFSMGVISPEEREAAETTVTRTYEQVVTANIIVYLQHAVEGDSQ